MTSAQLASTPQPQDNAAPVTQPGRRTIKLLLALGLVLVLSLYAWSVQRHSLLTDDGYISFRFAHNLASGHGLVFNPGERVEGYTNFLWTLLLAGGIRLGIPPELGSVLLGTASGASVLLLVFFLGRLQSEPTRAAGSTEGPISLAFLLPGWLAALLLAAHRSFAGWSTGGLEPQLFSLCILAGYVLLVRERRAEAAWPWASSTCLGLAALTRPEGVLFAGVAGLCLLVDQIVRRRGWRTILIWPVPFALLVGAHLVFRLSYYGAWVPNTFHAKVNGLWPERAAVYLDLFVQDYGLWPFLPLVLVALWGRRSFLNSLFATALVVHLAYLVAIGGDFLEFRFLVPVLPMLYWLMADGLSVLWTRQWGGGQARTVLRYLAVIMLGVLGVNTVQASFDKQAGRSRNDVEGLAFSRAYCQLRQQQGQLLQRHIEAGNLPRQLRISTGAIGALPYFTQWHTVDRRGLIDPEVATLPLDERGRIGHEHDASLGHIREQGVALVLLGHRLIFPIPAQALPIVEQQQRRELERYNDSRALEERDRLRYRCARLPDGAFLIFGTHLSEDELAQVLPLPDNCGPPEQPTGSAPGA